MHREYRKRQKKFAEIVAKTGDLELANRTVYPASKKHFSTRLTNKQIQKDILEIWKSQGLTLELATRRHKELLEKGEGSVALKAAEMVYRGNKIPEFAREPDVAGAKSILQIFIDQRKERGLPLPEGIVDV